MKVRERILREAWEMGKIVLFALIAALIIKENVLAAAQVPTGSMEETVMPGNRILINRLAYVLEEPERGDIVAFYWPDDPKQLFLKRIMGVPGDTIQGMDGLVYINGLPLIKDYTSIKLEQDFKPFVVPEDCYFMMGDNRNNSWDSRYWNNAFVKKEDIMGKVKIVFYPELKILR